MSDMQRAVKSFSQRKQEYKAILDDVGSANRNYFVQSQGFT